MAIFYAVYFVFKEVWRIFLWNVWNHLIWRINEICSDIQKNDTFLPFGHLGQNGILIFFFLQGFFFFSTFLRHLFSDLLYFEKQLTDKMIWRLNQFDFPIRYSLSIRAKHNYQYIAITIFQQKATFYILSLLHVHRFYFFTSNIKNLV